MMDTYKIMRFYAEYAKKGRTIRRGLSLKEAKEHCLDPKSMKTSKDGRVVYFEGFTKED